MRETIALGILYVIVFTFQHLNYEKKQERNLKNGKEERKYLQNVG